MSVLIPPARPTQKVSDLHDAFLLMLPRIELHARIRFRQIRCLQQKDDAVAETVAIAWNWFVRLTRRGKNPRKFVSTLATLAVLAVRNGRRLCGQEKAKDVLSPRAQQRCRFSVRKLADGTSIAGNPLEEALRDNTETPVPDQVAFRCDFPAWLASLSDRDRRVVHNLARGERTLDVSRVFGISPARVSQLRGEFRQDWEAFCGDSLEIV